MSHDPIPPSNPEAASGGSRRRRRVGIIVGPDVVAAMVFIYCGTHGAVPPTQGGGGGGGGRGGGFGRFGMMNGPLPVVARPAVKGDLNVYLNGLGAVTPLATVVLRTQIRSEER